ncbi:MAG: CRISPR-associated helicase/endonuclease Cas3 [Thermodesulfovibrionales bacterium]
MKTKIESLYFRYWGKADPEYQGESKWHLLVYHCLDVTAVAAAWWAASPAIRRGFRIHNTISEEQIRAWVLFFTALHDYGKFDVRFQLRAAQVWQEFYPNAGSYNALPSVQDCKVYYHGERGLAWFMDDHAKMLEREQLSIGDSLSFLDDLEETCSDRWLAWKPWLEAVAGHHGNIKYAENVDPSPLPPTCDKRLSDIDLQARKEWLVVLEELFLRPVSLSLKDIPPVFSPLMAGFCSVSDWLGSRCDEQNFSYRQETQDLREYFEEKHAEDAVRVLDLAGITNRSQPYAGVVSLLKPDSHPRSMQILVDKLPMESGLTIVEAPTGSGKTEAALAYAWRLINAGLADSIVFALPTQATANAMLGRLERIASLLFESRPNVLLAHGSARFNKDFIRIKHSAIKGYEGEDGWVQCSEWLAESRKRVFLGQIGVCTVDQVLISVLPVKHRFVRGFGVGRSVLIVDEVHAYDAYMYGLLEEVLRQQKASGGAAILLSATLPERQRQKLCAAWSAELEQQEEKAPYPLATWTAGTTTTPFELPSEQQPQKNSVKIETVRVSQMVPDELLLLRVISAAAQGAQVAIVCNLVDVAQKLARRLRAMTDLPVDLFHARYCYSHRQEKELDAIKHFGPEGERTSGRIIVATQVIEQSLDLDFDWLITQLCPVDLLFQRIGRLHRHNRSSRPAGFEEPLCTVLLPEDDASYGLHEKIYANTRVLWRTAQQLLSATEGRIGFPEAYRTWIEPAYSDESWEDEPEEVEKGYEKFRDEVEFVKRMKARFIVDAALNPFADTDEKITAVTRDGEMNLTVVPYCLGSHGKTLMDGTVFEQLEEIQRFEALSLNSVGVPNSWKGYFDEGIVDREGRFWLEMKRDSDSYTGASKGVTFHYHKDMGLEKTK